jgi:hypothetical protein
MRTLDPPVQLPFDALDLSPETVALRFRQAMALGRPRWVWPDVPVAQWRASLHAIEGTLRSRLAQPDRPARLESPAGARVLGIAAFSSGTGPLLGHWAEGGLLDTAPDTAALLLLHLAHGRARAQRRAELLGDVIHRMHTAGVVPVIVKGMHTASALFPEPGTRPMSDLDLVLRPEDFPRAEQSLSAAGYQHLSAGRVESPLHADWLPPGSTLDIPSLELDHVRSPLLVNLRGGFLFPVLGRRVLRLGEPGAGDLRAWHQPAAQVLEGAWMLTYLAVHASLMRSSLTLIRLTELVLAARAMEDWDRLTTLLRETGAGPNAYPAIRLAERLAPGSFPAPVLRELERHALRRHRRLYDQASPADAQPSGERELVDFLYWVAGPRDLARLLLHLAVPDRPLRHWPAFWARRLRLAWNRIFRRSR